MPVGVVRLNAEIAERSGQSQRTRSSPAQRHLVTTTTTRSCTLSPSQYNINRSVPEYIDGADGDFATAEELLSIYGRVKESREGENTFLLLILLTRFFKEFSFISV